MCMWTPASNPRGGELFQLTGHSLRSVTKNRISWHEPNAYSAPDPVPNVLQIFDSLNSHNYALVEVTLILFILQSRHTGVQELGQGRGARTGLWPQLVWLLFVFLFVCLPLPYPPAHGNSWARDRTQAASASYARSLTHCTWAGIKSVLSQRAHQNLNPLCHGRNSWVHALKHYVSSNNRAWNWWSDSVRSLELLA